MKTKIALVGFGCKVNTSENEFFSYGLAEKGYEIVSEQDADIVVVNTCAVTRHAASKCASYIAALKRKRPDVKIAATGCLVGFSQIKGADILITNGSKGSLIDHITAFTSGLKPADDAPFYGGAFKGATRTRAFFKIQDGCDSFCKYCAIPQMRGKPRSKPFAEAVSDFKKFLEYGFKEIVLVGIHIGLYGRGTDKNLTDLVETLSNIDGDFRIRLSSIEIPEITDRLLELIKNRVAKICPHFHIPLQSGSDEILKKMGRKYTALNYIDTVQIIKKEIPNSVVGSDVIVGFPGETEDFFNETVSTLQKANTDLIHVFPYSVRENTVAASMENAIPASTKRFRAGSLRNMWKDVKLERMREFIGKKMRVLVETNSSGHLDNYLPIKLSGSEAENTFCTALITGIQDGIFTGERI